MTARIERLGAALPGDAGDEGQKGISGEQR